MFKAAVRSGARATVRRMIVGARSRDAMNFFYLMLSPSGRVRFQSEFAKIFREGSAELKGTGNWRVSFAGKTLRLPLTSENLWQEWDSAVSIVGNDMEVKRTYEALLLSHRPPDLFVDVGANYGTHSLLFLAAGVPTLTFEPNPACHDYFMRACALNGFAPQLEKVALGREAGSIVLSYPPKDTWFGSTHPEAVQKLGPSVNLVSVEVGMRTLDSYLDRFADRKRMLLKIDTEGNELSVLQGGEEVLRRLRPTLVFESLVTHAGRPMLYEFLRSAGYEVSGLPLLKPADRRPLDTAQFVDSTATNFFAIPGGD